MCVWQVFLREVERQRLQDLLHQEVLRRIVTLQRRFRALLERNNFIRMRQAACQIQVRLGLPTHASFVTVMFETESLEISGLLLLV